MAIIPTPVIQLRDSATTISPAPSCITAIPDANGYVPPDACNANYGFYPSWLDNMIFTIVFGLITTAHLAQAITFKKKFCWVIIMGASWECFCFVLRTLGAKDQQNSTYVMLSTLLFLLAPLWINAFAYMIVARLVYMFGPNHQVTRIPATWLAKGFVSADIICFAIQAVGGGLMAGGDDNPKNAELGKKIYMAGCSVQLVSVIVFLGVVGAFYYSLESGNVRKSTPSQPTRWLKPLLGAILLVLVLIIERIIFRLVEFSRGASSSNPILQHEWYQLYLDALPMAIALVALNIMHPGLVLVGPEGEMPSSKLLSCCCRRKAASFDRLPLDSLERLNDHRA